MAEAVSVDWAALRSAAEAAAAHAYAPYSRYRVGAAGLVDDGRIVSGCNVENASYGLTLCAECGMVSDLHRSGGGRLLAVTCVAAAEGEPLRVGSPCGRCRQLLFEAGGGRCLVETSDGVVRLDALLPGAFGPADLPPGP
jgi:cytidine deaminase